MNQTADLTEKTLSREEKYQGSFLSLHVDQVQLPNGRTSFREVVEHVDGVAILALDDRNNVLTVTQYRYVIGKTLLEIPAGKLEPGEDPVAGALRELKEETGAVPDTFLPMGVTLPSPGCLSERLYLFLAKGLHMESQQLDEDEFLNVERIPFNEMVHRVMDGEIEDSKTIAAVLKAAARCGAAAPAVPVKDTIKQAKGGSGKTVPAGCMVEDTPDRSTLYAVQTPQCFDRAAYLAALDELDETRARLVTDDCSLFELTGRPVELVQGDYANIKITTREDLPRAENGGKKMRIGHGYDVHRLVEGRKLILGGVEVPYEKGLLGHSDADVLAHAVMDAVLGAAALGDIGQHFPDTAEEYAGADSLVLARRVAEIVAAQGWRIENIDATILCQRPKLAPYIPVMREKLAAAFGLPVEAVSVKATTEEHLGFTGEGLGIAAHAVALIEAV